MVKTKLGIEQIIAGALLLGFDRVSNVDITLLSEDFLRKNPNYSLDGENPGYINKYITVKNGNILLEDGLDMDSYIPENESSLRKRLEQIAGACIREYLETFNMEEYVLRKINSHYELSEGDIERLYCKRHQEEIKKLEEKGYITRFWEDGFCYDDEKITKLSDSGRVALFKLNNADEIERFTEELKILRYDTSLLDDFLLKQDLEFPVWNILSIENLEQFCKDYDRSITASFVSNVYFKRLLADKDSLLDESGKALIQDMLSVWDECHCIYICHPNHVFGGPKLLTKDVKDIKCVNWDDINIEEMFEIDSYGVFWDSDCSAAFKYIHNYMMPHIMKAVQKGNIENASRYLTIVEQYSYDNEDYYLIRGIVKGDNKGYSVAFNPEYQKAIPKTGLDKSLRFCGREVPQAYRLKRKK